MATAAPAEPVILRLSPEDIPERRHAARWKRWRLPLLVTLCVFATLSFLVLIILGYREYAGRHDGGPAPVVRADPRAVKIRPEQAGGRDVPDIDKEVLHVTARHAGGSAPPPQRVEQLLPPPEAPQPKPGPILVAPPPPAPLVVAESETPNAAAIIHAAASPAAGMPASQQSVVARAVAPSTPAPQPDVAKLPPGSFRIQVAALRTENEARLAWQKLKLAHLDPLGPLAVSYSRVDLAEKGSFVRVHAGPFRDRGAAQAACAKLAQARAGCLIVAP
jgi:cell division septation protein DedD